MTESELALLFEAQLSAGPSKVFYMKQQGGPEAHQITASILSHDVVGSNWGDLLASLAGYTYTETMGGASWPRFVKDTV